MSGAGPPDGFQRTRNGGDGAVPDGLPAPGVEADFEVSGMRPYGIQFLNRYTFVHAGGPSLAENRKAVPDIFERQTGPAAWSVSRGQ